MNRTLTLILAALAALPLCETQAAAGKNNEPLKVMTYNIRRSGTRNDGTNSWEFRYQATFDMIADQKPDVIAMQEVMPLQRLMLDEEVKGYKGVGAGCEDGKKKGEQTAIYYNKKTVSISKWGFFWLSENPSKPGKGWDASEAHTATWALAKDKRSGKKFWLVNVHLDNDGLQAKENGLKLALERIAGMNKAGLPVVLAGNFNMAPTNKIMKILDGKMQDARSAAARTDDTSTFNGWGKSSVTLDYIWFSGFPSCGEFSVVTKSYSGRKFISDHHPVTATLNW